MELEQVKQLLTNKKAILEENGWTDREEYRVTLNRLSDLEYHSERNTMVDQQHVQDIIDAVAREEERQAVQEQKIAEVDEMVLPFDIDKELGTEGVNALVRQMLKEERAKNFAEFNAEFDRIQAEADEKIRAAEEREINLQRQNSELQAQADEDERTMETLYNESKGLREQVTVLSSEKEALRVKLNETELRLAEVEQNRKNAADQLAEYQNEVLRLEDQVDELRRVNALGERQAQRVIEVTETAKNLFEAAKQATAAKRQVMVTDTIGLYRAITDVHGNTEVVHASQLDEVEVVTEFPALPEITFEQEPVGTEYDVEESPVVFGGSEDTEPSDLVEEVRQAAFEAGEVAQETAYSEEVGETFEQEIRRRLGNLEQTIFGYVDGQEAA